MFRRLAIPVALSLAFAFAPSALASGGNYFFDGGTRAEQAQVRSALDASSFNWSIVPGPVAIHIAPGAASRASLDTIWLDARLLDSGRFAWGVVQHEYAHQVDFSLLTDPMRAQLHGLLHGTSWWGAEGHAELDCERFADALAWAYWPSPDNVMRPQSGNGEGGLVAPEVFRAAVAGFLHLGVIRSTASVQWHRHPRNG
jgi:hypothetical protein